MNILSQSWYNRFGWHLLLVIHHYFIRKLQATWLLAQHVQVRWQITNLVYMSKIGLHSDYQFVCCYRIQSSYIFPSRVCTPLWACTLSAHVARGVYTRFLVLWSWFSFVWSQSFQRPLYTSLAPSQFPTFKVYSYSTIISFWFTFYPILQEFSIPFPYLGRRHYVLLPDTRRRWWYYLHTAHPLPNPFSRPGWAGIHL